MNGYHQVTLSFHNKAKNCYVHRLVAEAFVEGQTPFTPDINHKDSNKSNNHKDNLEWSTRSQNILHAIDAGTNPSRGETHPMAKLSDEQVLKILASPLSAEELSKIYNVSKSNIQTILRRQSWRHIS